MASFCTKCGATLSGTTQFCTACGAPVGAAAMPGSPQPVPVPPAQAPSGGASVLKVILIIIGVFVGLGVLAVCIFAFTVWRIAKTAHVNSANGTVTLSTPGGTITAGDGSSASAADLGVDIYPGATRQQGGLQISTSTGSSITAVYTTSDPLSKVVDFYKGKLGPSASFFQSDQSAVFTQATADRKDSFVVTVSTDTSSPGSPTKIAIVHTKST